MILVWHAVEGGFIMRHATLAVVAFVVALTMRPATAAAQDWSQPWADPLDRPARVDISVSGGVLMPTRWSDLVLLGSGTPAGGVLEQVLTRDIHVEPDTEFTAAATYWRSRYGLRVRGGFSRSSVSIGAVPLAGVSLSTPPANAVGAASSIGIDTWLYDLGLSIGFLEYEPRRVVWPYGFFGVGGITYDLKQAIAPPLAFLEHPPSAPPANTIIVTDQHAEHRDGVRVQPRAWNRLSDSAQKRRRGVAAGGSGSHRRLAARIPRRRIVVVWDGANRYRQPVSSRPSSERHRRIRGPDRTLTADRGSSVVHTSDLRIR